MRTSCVLLIAVLAACGGGKDQASSSGTDNARPARDFKKAGSWSFDYKQDMTMKDLSKDEPRPPAMAKATGEIRVTSNGDGTAKMTMDAQMTASGDIEGDVKMPRMDLTLEEMPSGKAGGQEEAMMMLLFPLPTKPLRKGETETQTFAIPASIGNKQIELTAPFTITRTGVDTIGGKPCAAVQTKLRLDHNSPEGTSKMHVDGTACIDLADGLVRRSTMKIAMGVSSTTDDLAVNMDMSGTLDLTRK